MSDRPDRPNGVPYDCASCGQSLVSFSPDTLAERDSCPYCKEDMEEQTDG